MPKGFSNILMILPLWCLVGCEKPGLHPDEDNQPPTANFYISPPRGDTTIPFVLDASRSKDQEDIDLFLEYRWDLDGDSLWDTEFIKYPYYVIRFPVPGTHPVAVQVRDRYGLVSVAKDTAFTYGMITDTSHFRDQRDGQVYKTVKIKGVWWMAENLNIGTMIRDTAMPQDNGIIEKFCYSNDPTLYGEVGGYYTYYDWFEMMEYDTLAVTGVCPPGWALPTFSDWVFLKIGYGHGYFVDGGFSNLNLSLIGYHTLTKEWEEMNENPLTSFWMYFSRTWEKDFYNKRYIPCPFVESSWQFDDHYYTMRWVNDSVEKYRGALPVRCIKRD